jgi:hypothetical protein
VNLATLACILLLPIVPALLIFWLLPSTAIVSGPLRGFKLDLGGAFAGYFALVLLVLFTHNVWAPEPTYQVWEVSGTVTDEEGLAFAPLDEKNIALTPRALQLSQGGTFALIFDATPAPGGGEMSYPQLTVSYPGYVSQTIPLDPHSANSSTTMKIQADMKGRRITIEHIVLHKMPPYAADQAPLEPASSQEVRP